MMARLKVPSNNRLKVPKSNRQRLRMDTSLKEKIKYWKEEEVPKIGEAIENGDFKGASSKVQALLKEVKNSNVGLDSKLSTGLLNLEIKLKTTKRELNRWFSPGWFKKKFAAVELKAVKEKINALDALL